jgi:hypothetical protein
VNRPSGGLVRPKFALPSTACWSRRTDSGLLHRQTHDSIPDSFSRATRGTDSHGVPVAPAQSHQFDRVYHGILPIVLPLQIAHTTVCFILLSSRRHISPGSYVSSSFCITRAAMGVKLSRYQRALPPRRLPFFAFYLPIL